MTGKQWLTQFLKNKINECHVLEESAKIKGDYQASARYSVAYFKLVDKLLKLGELS